MIKPEKFDTPEAVRDIYLTALKDDVAIESVSIDKGAYTIWSRKNEMKPTYKSFWVELQSQRGIVLDERVQRINWTIRETIGLGYINPSALLHVNVDSLKSE